MGKLLSEFAPLEGFSGLHCAVRGELRCTAIRLRTGGLCLFSPVQGLGEKAIASLEPLGGVEVLLAPNHYHNKGLREYAEAFPHAWICASNAAAPRLAKLTRLRIEGLDKLRTLLSKKSKLVSPDGLKTGEVWLSMRGADSSAWVVVDAFCGSGGNMKTIAAAPDLLSTFPRYGVADRSAYRQWLERQIEVDDPSVIVPCHGAVIRSRRLPFAIRRLMESKL